MKSISLPKEKTIHSKRLIIKPVDLNDSAGFFAMRQDPEVVKLMDLSIMHSLDDAKKYIAERITFMKDETCLFWAVKLKENDQFIGSVCLWNFRPKEGKAEIGYELLNAFQGKGYASEAAEAIIFFAFEKLNFSIVDAAIHPENKSSQKLLTRNGFVQLHKSAVSSDKLYFERMKST